MHTFVNFSHCKIRFRVDKPDYLNAPNIPDYDVEHSVYEPHKADIPIDVQKPLGKMFVLAHYFNIILMCDDLSELIATGVCTFYNKIFVNWYCKQQSISEIAAYGAAFLSGRKCCEKSLSIERTFNIRENQHMIWTTNEKTTRV